MRVRARAAQSLQQSPIGTLNAKEDAAVTAHQRHPAMGPGLQRIAIDHGKFVDSCGATNDVRYFYPAEIPILEL